MKLLRAPGGKLFVSKSLRIILHLKQVAKLVQRQH